MLILVIKTSYCVVIKVTQKVQRVLETSNYSAYYIQLKLPPPVDT